MRKTFLNHEYSKKTMQTLSGTLYVTTKEKHDPFSERGKLVIAQPSRCGHVNRICTDCANNWPDHEILWERTVGGRRMREELDRLSR